MAHDYDKVIRENLEALFIPIAERMLGMKIIYAETISVKLQTTVPREIDSVKKVITDQNQQYILHLEFQSTNDPEMVYRNAEYRAMLQRIYKIPVRQFVIYLGKDKPTMRTELLEEEVISGFNLVNVHDFKADAFVNSNIPEEILLTVLSDFGNEDKEALLTKIIKRIQQLSADSYTKLERYLTHLFVLARLRNLSALVEKIVKTMPVTYDIKTDHLYREGKVEGKIEGKIEQQREVIIEMLKDPSMTDEKIAKFTKTSVEFVREVKKQQGFQ